MAFESLTEKIDTSTPVGLAVFSILAAISQLERDLIAERVKAGLANARAKGIHVGRRRLRDSDLIRKLLKADITFRQVAQIAKCSHGSVYAEKLLMRNEEYHLPRDKVSPELSITSRLIKKCILVFIFNILNLKDIMPSIVDICIIYGTLVFRGIYGF